jgi:hypothetical protein
MLLRAVVDTNKIFRFLKVLFASFAAAVGIGITGIAIGLFIFGSDQTDNFIDNYVIYALLLIALIIYPLMAQHLK